MRVRALATADAPINLEELRSLEQTLRPVAGAVEIQQALVPLLDQTGLRGLAMAWDGEPATVTDAWLRARFERWVALAAPELAFLTLAQLQARGASVASDRERAQAVLEREREAREPLFARNMAALQVIDPGLYRRVEASPRLSVALRPLGAGMSEYTGTGSPPLQLWAATPAEAAIEAERLCMRSKDQPVWFIAGVGDCTLPASAARAALGQAGAGASSLAGTVHIIEAHLVRMRAMLEVVDFADALATGKVRLHGGAPATESIADVLRTVTHLREEMVVGGDSLAISILQSAAEHLNGL